jgi:hypothetical protein
VQATGTSISYRAFNARVAELMSLDSLGRLRAMQSSTRPAPDMYMESRFAAEVRAAEWVRPRPCLDAWQLF